MRGRILTGSQILVVSQAVSQSLAGRAGILHLLPLSRDELAGFSREPRDLFELLWTGGYPRIYDRGIPAQQWLADYVATYIQRDVRQILNIGDLNRFTAFLRLCAAHTAQELRLSALGADAGVSHNTTLTLVEGKSGETVAGDFFAGLHSLQRLLSDAGVFESIRKQLVYGGSDAVTRNDVQLIPWNRV